MTANPAAEMADNDAASSAALREQAYALYRRSDNIPLGGDGDALAAQIDRVAELRNRADALIKIADDLDGQTT